MRKIARAILPVALVALLAGCSRVAPPLSIAELEAKAAAGDTSAYKGFVEYLGSSRTGEEQRRAYIALVAAGQKAAAEVRQALESSDPAVREHAFALAGNLKLEGTFDLAAKTIADTSLKRRHSAAWALGELGDERAIPILATAMGSDPDELTRREAARAINRFEMRATPALLEQLPKAKTEYRGTILRVLGELRDPAGKAAIIGGLKDPATREDAVWALGSMGKAGDFFDPTPYLSDPDWNVRVMAARAVGLIGIKGAKPTLDKMRMNDPVKAVREWAARGLALIDGTPSHYRTTSGELESPDNLYH